MIKNFLYYFNKILRSTYANELTSRLMCNSLFCRVCGLEQGDPPWGDDGKTSNFNICECCGTEFGYHDFTLEGIREHRQSWIKKGYKWSSPKYKPENWDPQKQMKNIPTEFQ